MRASTRAAVGDDDEVVARAGADAFFVGAFFAGAFFAGAFFAGVFFAGAFFAGAFFVGAFFVGAFFAGAFFAGVFFAGAFWEAPRDAVDAADPVRVVLAMGGGCVCGHRAVKSPARAPQAAPAGASFGLKAPAS